MASEVDGCRTSTRSVSPSAHAFAVCIQVVDKVHFLFYQLLSKKAAALFRLELLSYLKLRSCSIVAFLHIVAWVLKDIAVACLSKTMCTLQPLCALAIVCTMVGLGASIATIIFSDESFFLFFEQLALPRH